MFIEIRLELYDIEKIYAVLVMLTESFESCICVALKKNLKIYRFSPRLDVESMERNLYFYCLLDLQRNRRWRRGGGTPKYRRLERRCQFFLKSKN